MNHISHRFLFFKSDRIKLDEHAISEILWTLKNKILEKKLKTLAAKKIDKLMLFNIYLIEVGFRNNQTLP